MVFSNTICNQMSPVVSVSVSRLFVKLQLVFSAVPIIQRVGNFRLHGQQIKQQGKQVFMFDFRPSVY